MKPEHKRRTHQHRFGKLDRHSIACKESQLTSLTLFLGSGKLQVGYLLHAGTEHQIHINLFHYSTPRDSLEGLFEE